MERDNTTEISTEQFNSTIDHIQLELFTPSIRASLIILFTTTCVLAFISNVIVVLVCYYGTRTGKTLKVLLSNLAISDILPVVFHYPVAYTKSLYSRWLFPFWMCPLNQFSYSVWNFVNVSIITLISIERYNQGIFVETNST